jgi:CyaY protein
MALEGMTEATFERMADTELAALLSALDGLHDDLEIDLESGILTLEFSDGAKYVINSHRAARQIWMAAERNAWHFDPAVGASAAPDERDAARARWTAAKGGDELWSVVEAVVTRKLGQPVRLRGH